MVRWSGFDNDFQTSVESIWIWVIYLNELYSANSFVRKIWIVKFSSIFHKKWRIFLLLQITQFMVRFAQNFCGYHLNIPKKTYQASSLIIENPNISSKQPSAILNSYQFWSALATNSPVGISYLILAVFSKAVTVEALRKMLAASMHKIEILL